MSKRIEMNYKTENGSYEVLYPETGNWSKEQILSSDTANNLGIGSDGTPDQAFGLLFNNGVFDKTLVQSYMTEQNQPVEIQIDQQYIGHGVQVEIINNNMRSNTGWEFQFSNVRNGFYTFFGYTGVGEPYYTTNDSMYFSASNTPKKFYLNLSVQGNMSSAGDYEDSISSINGNCVYGSYIFMFFVEPKTNNSIILTIEPSVQVVKPGSKVNIYKY